MLAAVACLGLTACVMRSVEAAGCPALSILSDEARAALLDHEQDVPEEVGEAATRLIIGVNAACDR